MYSSLAQRAGLPSLLAIDTGLQVTTRRPSLQVISQSYTSYIMYKDKLKIALYEGMQPRQAD